MVLVLAWETLVPLELRNPVSDCTGFKKNSARLSPQDILVLNMIPLGDTRLNILVKATLLLVEIVTMTGVHLQMGANNFKQQHYLGIMLIDLYGKRFKWPRICRSPIADGKAITIDNVVYRVMDSSLYKILLKDVCNFHEEQLAKSQTPTTLLTSTQDVSEPNE